MAASSKPKPAKVGDVLDLKGAASVVIPGGTVVSTYMRYRFELPGLHTVDGVEYDVTPGDA